MRSRLAAAVTLVCAIIGAAGCDGEGDGAAAAADVTIRAVEPGPFQDVPATVPSGEVTLRLVNEDAMAHSLRVEELGEGVDLVSGGDEGSATVTLEPATTYTVYCDVPGHRDLGMEDRFETEA